MRRSLVLSSILILAAPLTLAAQAPEEPRLEWQVRLLGFHFDNFFQAPEDLPERDVEAARGEVRGSYRLRPEGTTSLFATAGFTAYREGLDDSPVAGIGLESETERREWLLGLEHTRDQPVFDVGDELEQADTLRFEGAWGYRVTEGWEATLLGEWERQDFELTPGKDNDLYSAGGAIRYRGWGYELSPEIGMDVGRRDADDPNEDHDQQDLWLKLRSVPVPPLYVSLRYRLRTREYTVGDPLASNFGREDDRDYWTLNARYRLTDRVALDLYYNYLDADSDKESRIFTTQILGLGVTFGRF
ncbi:MAG: hypothetical protein R3234_01645 [Thermoanaerobaculia bacterium]|nr:hypothetical protein [Thermoanaerobaculia bacterium]